MKFALEDPAGTVTFGGTLATDGLLLTRDMVRPPVGAAPVRFAVPCALLPPTTLVGLTITDDNAVPVAVTVNEALTVAPYVAEMVAVPGDVT